MIFDRSRLPATESHRPCKLQTDASRCRDTGFSAAGWVLTDHTGVPIASSSQELGRVASIDVAEQEAARRAITHLAETPVNHLIVKTDNESVAKKIDPDQSQFIRLTIEHTDRTEITIADSLAQQTRRVLVEVNG